MAYPLVCPTKGDVPVGQGDFEIKVGLSVH